MALNQATLATQFKTAFSTSPDPAIKALTDAHWDQMAAIIFTFVKSGQIAGVVCDPTTGVQLPPFPPLT